MSTLRKAIVHDDVADGVDLSEQIGQSSASAARNVSIDDIMWRVRAEVARRRNGVPSKEPTPTYPNPVPSFEESIPSWKPAAARAPAKDKYTLPELLVFSDADFIDVAYRAVLRRPADVDGFNYYLRLLRAGAHTKVEILGILRLSD